MFFQPFFFFFFNDTATTEIYTLSLHDALPISESHHWDTGRRLGGPHCKPSTSAHEIERLNYECVANTGGRRFAPSRRVFGRRPFLKRLKRLKDAQTLQRMRLDEYPLSAPVRERIPRRAVPPGPSRRCWTRYGWRGCSAIQLRRPYGNSRSSAPRTAGRWTRNAYEAGARRTHRG